MLVLLRTIIEISIRRLIIFTFIYIILYIVLSNLVSQYFPESLQQFQIIFFLLYIAILIQILLVQYYKIKNELDKNLFLFIPYLYSIAHVTTNISNFFSMAKENEDFPFISFYFKKIDALRKRFKYSYPEVIRYVLSAIPETEFKGFMERLATALEVGEDLTEFLDREHKAYLEKYEASYKKSFENLRLLQELSLAFMSSLAFTFTLIILIPFLTGGNFYLLMIYFFIVFISTSITVYYLSKYLILEDPLWAKLKEKPEEYKKIYNLTILFILLSFTIFLFLFGNGFHILYATTIAIIPLAYISYRIKLLEKSLRTKEEKFAAFFESLFNLSEVYGNNQLKILEHVRIHDFGELNEDIDRLYKRMSISRDYKTSWYYFLVELGSNLAYKIIGTFSKVLEYSGDVKEAGEKLYDVLIKILEMRDLKSQFISTFRGFNYGGFIAFSLVLFISIQILNVTYQMITGLSTLTTTELTGIIGLGIFTVEIDINLVELIISIIVFIQALIVALSISNVTGGSKLGMFIDLMVLLLIAAGIHFLSYYFFGKILGGLSIVKT